MNLRCESCGAMLQSVETGKCTYCGSIVNIELASSLFEQKKTSKDGNLLVLAEVAINAKNYDEAYNFYNKILENDITNADAWLGKGISIVYTSKIGELKIKQAIEYWKNAISNAQNHQAYSKRIAKEIDHVVNSFYPVLENHYKEFYSLDNSFYDLVNRFAELEAAQAYSISLVENVDYFKTGYELCNRVINLPQAFVASEKGVAFIEGMAGVFSDNKYKMKGAQSRRDKAQQREEEISKAKKVVYQLQQKYVKGLEAVDPSYAKSLSNKSGPNIYNLNADEKTNLASELKKIKKFNIIGISLFVITIIIVGAAGESNTTDPNLALALVAFFGFIIGALLSLISSFKKSTIKKKYQLSGYEMKELLKNGVN
jgi:hypothetical protein